MKNYLHKILLAVVTLLLINSNLKASSGIGVSLINYTLDTSHQVYLGYNITVTAEVHNFDATPFAGQINFGLRNNNYNLSSVPDALGKPNYSGTQIFLYGNETVPAIFNIHIDPQYFAPGPDVVVVWPICNQPIADSIVIDITVISLNGIKSTTEDNFSCIVLNNKLLLKNTNAEINFKQVRFYNLIGQQVFEFTGNFITEVPVPALPKGIYVAEFVTADQQRKTFKFLY